MKYVKALGFAAAALAAMPVTSYAQQMAYTAKDVNLRAGPSRDYPVVAILRGGISISITGCISDYRWCDVVAGPYRGWVYAQNIVYPYQGDNVPVLTFGALIGIGIITFSIGSYWDDHYRASPWYPQRYYWIDRPPRPIFPPVRPRQPRPGPGFGPGQGLPPPPPPPQMRAPDGRQPPPPMPGPGAGQAPPPQMRRQEGAQPPPQMQAPDRRQPPPQIQRQDGGQRPPPMQRQDRGQRQPPVQGPGGGQPPPQMRRQDGG